MRLKIYTGYSMNHKVLLEFIKLVLNCRIEIKWEIFWKLIL
jgi:hypothetical protein